MKPKPFSNQYVIAETLKHMLASVEISIAKTIARLPEANDQPALGAEILLTLSNLHKLSALIVSIKDTNKDLLN
jgi:hypothetical protein